MDVSPIFLYLKKLTLCEWQDDKYLSNTATDDSVAHKFRARFLSKRSSLGLLLSVDPDYYPNDLPYQGLLDHCSKSLTDLQLSIGSQCMSCLSLSSTFKLHLNVSLVFRWSFVGEERLGEGFSLSTLERITFYAKMNFSISDTGDDRPGCQISSPIPAIEHAMKMISSQRLKLKLDFYFTIHGHHQRLPPAEVIWSPLVHLVAESPFP